MAVVAGASILLGLHQHILPQIAFRTTVGEQPAATQMISSKSSLSSGGKRKEVPYIPNWIFVVQKLQTCFKKASIHPVCFLVPVKGHSLAKAKNGWSLGFVSSVPENPGKIGGHGLPSMNELRLRPSNIACGWSSFPKKIRVLELAKSKK